MYSLTNNQWDDFVAKIRSNDESLGDSLNLSYRQLLGHDFAEFCRALETNSTLASINLNSTLFGPAGSTMIAEMLKNNSALTSIILSCNNIDDDSMKQITEALKSNATLTSIDLCSNEIRRAGLDIVEMLKVNTTLTFVDLTDNPVDEESVQQIMLACERNSPLNWVKMSKQIIDICIALAPIDLPAYVLLEIIDWLPFFICHERKTKLDLIVNVKKSISKFCFKK